MFNLRSISYWIVVLILFESCNQEQQTQEVCDKNGISSPYLLTAIQAQQFLALNDNIALIQISRPEIFHNEHLPSAINLWRPDFRSKTKTAISGLRCSKRELEELLSSIGVDSSFSLIVYDAKGSVDALRFTWVLDLYGFHNHKVINGGLASWKQSGFPTTTDTSQIPQIPQISQSKESKKYKISGQPDSSLLATLSDVQSAIKDPNTIIVDTRESYEYLGQPFIYKNEVHTLKKGAYTSGAIPSAIHLNWSVLSDLAGDHRIKCEKDLRYDLSKIGITPDKNIIVYCQSGSRSSHTAFVLRHILGYPNVKNYDGSWIEWSYENVHNNSVSIDQKTDTSSVNEMIALLEIKIKNNQ